jgi:hypothetical protein
MAKVNCLQEAKRYQKYLSNGYSKGFQELKDMLDLYQVPKDDTARVWLYNRQQKHAEGKIDTEIRAIIADLLLIDRGGE